MLNYVSVACRERDQVAFPLEIIMAWEECGLIIMGRSVPPQILETT